MYSKLELGTILHNGTEKNPFFKFEIQDHFPFDPLGEIDFGNSLNGPSNMKWVIVNNKLIADRVFIHTVSFRDLQGLNLFRGRRVVIDGQKYRIRMLMDLDEWLTALDAIGENNLVWHMERQSSFLQQPAPEPGMACCTGLRRLNSVEMVTQDSRQQNVGWRPVLESLGPDFSKLEIGHKILCWGGKSLVNGILLENGTYDLVVQRQDGTNISTKDAKTFASPAMGDKVIVNKAAVAGLKGF